MTSYNATAAAKGQPSPMIVQYRRIKQTHRDKTLFFRLGDFYEMFGEDAVEVSSLLNITLTSRNNMPMCGIPCHAARSYIARLLRFGKKVALCEQITEPARGKTLLEREVVEVITPGTVVDDDYLEMSASNYLAALFNTGREFSFAYIDLSTAEFCPTVFRKNVVEELRGELERLEIREILVQESLMRENSAIARALEERGGLLVNRWADWLFDMEKSRERLVRQFGTENLKGFGIDKEDPGIIAAGALLDYLDDTARNLLLHIRGIRRYTESEFTGIDESSMRNMELFRNQHDGSAQYSLFEVVDYTRTAMGKRLLKQRLAHPLLDRAAIEKRLSFAAFFHENQSVLAKTRDALGKTPDVGRLASRLAMDKTHGKDMLALKNVLLCMEALEKQLPESLAVLFEAENARAAGKTESREQIATLRTLLEESICDDPSTVLTEGKLIRRGFNGELDRLHELHENGRNLLENYLEEEREATGISTLRIRFNRLIGYYFEVSKVHLAKVPRRFIRRQAVSTGERYTTDRLASLEAEINGAQDNIIEMEKRLFLEVRAQAKALLEELSGVAARIAEIDAAQSTARAATERLWIRPEITENCRLAIVEGRHPVVESYLPAGEFIPNDVFLDADEYAGRQPPLPPAFALITGPNMAGKSTYLRQAALITIMAQAGIFVPAAKASIGITDRIYCRVGASDNISRGESTFLVEMNETACILNTATSRSLVIMDEVGRGTGARDGLAIAQAVCEDLLDRLKCRTLFATHYHELAAMRHQRLVNRSLEVEELDGKIVFRRRLVERPAAESYGLHVARLAGLSEQVLRRAAELLRESKSANGVPPAEPFPALVVKNDEDEAPPPKSAARKKAPRKPESSPPETGLFD